VPGQTALHAPVIMIQTNVQPADETQPYVGIHHPVAVGERPQMRFQHFGVQALSDTELLALVLHHGMRAESALGLGSRLIADAGSLATLASWQAADFRRCRGIGQAKAQQLVAVSEIARRMMRTDGTAKPLLNRPEAIAAYLRPYANGLEVEKFWVLCLNRKNRLIKLVELTSGTATASLVHPREVFREAVRHAATAIACAHNHPSGDSSPSSADLQVTRQLREAARAVDIELVDHIILGRPEVDPNRVGHYSFRECGLL